jgi:hypothetical protein
MSWPREVKAAFLAGSGSGSEGSTDRSATSSAPATDTSRRSHALAAARREKARDVLVDTIGLGKGVHDAMRMEFPRTSAYRATDQPTDRSRFINRKAEDAWFLRELLEAGRIRIGPDSLLKSQLVAMKYQIDRAGRTRIVDPADSPDRVDALLIALAACRPSPLEITEDDFAFGETDIRDEHMGIL